MNKDQFLSRRRALLAGPAVLGAAAAAGARHATPDSPATAAPRSGPPPLPLPPPVPRRTGGPPRPSAYRLQPITGYGPVRGSPARTLVRHQPFLRMSGRGKTMVLTFDDGPDPRYTPDVLRTLKAHNVRAMFFVCGEMAADHKDLLRRMADEGHVVGNHTWSHPLLTRLTRSRSAPRWNAPAMSSRRRTESGPAGSGRRTGPGTGPPSRSAPNSAWSRSPGPWTPSTGCAGRRRDRAPGHQGRRPGRRGPRARRGGKPHAERDGAARISAAAAGLGISHHRAPAEVHVEPGIPRTSRGSVEFPRAVPVRPWSAQRTSARRANTTTFPL